MTTPFVGWLLDADERETLLVQIPPRYATVVAHHVTLKVRDETCPTPAPATGEIVGHADDGQGVEAVVVAIDGSATRPDGGTWHITWSLAEGREPRESNAVIASGWTRLPAPIPLALIPKPYG